MNETPKKAAKSILIIAVALVCAAAFIPASCGHVCFAGKKPAQVKGVTLKQTTQTGRDEYIVSVTWNKVKKAGKYQVQIENLKTKKTYCQTVGKSKRNTSFTGQNGAVYAVKVRAVKGKKKGKWSKEKRIEITPPKDIPYDGTLDVLK